MNIPVIACFNSAKGSGKTTIVYLLTWILQRHGHSVLSVDLDPQSDLTKTFLDEDQIEQLLHDKTTPATIYQSVDSLIQTGGLLKTKAKKVKKGIHLIPGDLALASLEDILSDSWIKSMKDDGRCLPFQILTAFWRIAQKAARRVSADIILMDLGSNLGAINRAALVASDYIITPLRPNLFSLHGVKNQGPVIQSWRRSWKKILNGWKFPKLPLPRGNIQPLGYVVEQYNTPYEKNMSLIPHTYSETMLTDQTTVKTPYEDKECLAVLKCTYALKAIGQHARKPMFDLTQADGAIGSHMHAVQTTAADFHLLAEKLLKQIKKQTPMLDSRPTGHSLISLRKD